MEEVPPTPQPVQTPSTTKAPNDEALLTPVMLAELVKAINLAYLRPGRLAWRAFIHGFWQSVGMFTGYVVLFIAFAGVFQALGGIKLLEPSMQKLQDAVLQAQLRTLSVGATGSQSSSGQNNQVEEGASGSGLLQVTPNQIQEFLTQYGNGQ